MWSFKGKIGPDVKSMVSDTHEDFNTKKKAKRALMNKQSSMSKLTWPTAALRAESPAVLVGPVSAPESRRVLTTPACPRYAALSRAVSPYLF